MFYILVRERDATKFEFVSGSYSGETAVELGTPRYFQKLRAGLSSVLVNYVKRFSRSSTSDYKQHWRIVSATCESRIMVSIPDDDDADLPTIQNIRPPTKAQAPAEEEFLSGFSKKNIFKQKPLKAGQYVVISNLKSKPELNGLVGKTGKSVKDASGNVRYGVSIDFQSELTREIAGSLSCMGSFEDRQRRDAQVTEDLHNMSVGQYAGTGKSATTFTSSAPQPDGTMKTETTGGFPPLTVAEFSLKRDNLEMVNEDNDPEVYRKKVKLDALGFDEDAEIAKDAASDGELDAAKVERNKQIAERQRAENLKKNPWMAGIQGGKTEPEKNPALDYPRTGTRPVLVVGGFGNCDELDGSSFTARALLNQNPELWRQWGCRFISFKNGNSQKAANNIGAALQSGQYQCCVLADPGEGKAVPKLAQRLGSVLKDYIENHAGTLAAWSAGGDVFTKQFLNKTWSRTELDWTMDSYYRATHAPFRKNRENIVKFFGESFAKKDWAFSVKGNMLTVPESDRYFATSQAVKMFRNLEDDYEASKDKDADRTSAIVAVKQFEGGGKLAYFGDINGEFATAMLIMAFLERCCAKQVE